jgi:dihydroorotase-like cyclic amidohydrolase
MSKVIKGGTIVAADRSYQADVLIEGEKIVAGVRDTRLLASRAIGLNRFAPASVTPLPSG